MPPAGRVSVPDHVTALVCYRNLAPSGEEKQNAEIALPPEIAGTRVVEEVHAVEIRRSREGAVIFPMSHISGLMPMRRWIACQSRLPASRSWSRLNKGPYFVKQERPHARSPRAVQCGVYEIDLDSGELRKNGLKVRLQEQPFKILAQLLARPGQLVTRGELQERLWGANSLIDPELGLNVAITKLRAAFDDSADNPRVIETIPKRGYRFLAPVRALERNGLGDLLETPEPPLPAARNELAETAPVADCVARLESGGSSKLPDENPLSPASESPSGEKDGRAQREVRRLALLAAALRKCEYMAARCGALILLLVCAAILAGQLLATSRGHSAPKRGVSVYRADPTPEHPGIGIGGYDLRSRSDQVFAFDYDHSGKLDHLVFYRPGRGMIRFIKNSGGSFHPILQGLGRYDLMSAADRIVAFDYAHSGKLDHLALYRLGTGIVVILRNDGDGVFTPVYERSTGNPGAPTLDSPADQVFAFDYGHSGKLDHLVLYRPRTGTVEIFTNAEGTFAPMCGQSAPPERTCIYDLKRPHSYALAFDYDHSGNLDHLVFYRPGARTMAILKNLEGTFVPVYEGEGIGGYDLKSGNDRAMAFDYDHSGKSDHLLLYRPGTGIASILKNTGGTFSPVYEGHGIGGYDFLSADDRAFAFDYNHTGKLDLSCSTGRAPGASTLPTCTKRGPDCEAKAQRAVKTQSTAGGRAESPACRDHCDLLAGDNPVVQT
jgi:DNA-binding winged helix-turn-helix (wHTH) protein